MEVKNYQSFNDLLHGNIKRFAAYVSQEEQNQTDYKIENTITIKVPVDQFDDLVGALTARRTKTYTKENNLRGRKHASGGYQVTDGSQKTGEDSNILTY